MSLQAHSTLSSWPYRSQIHRHFLYHPLICSRVLSLCTLYFSSGGGQGPKITVQHKIELFSLRISLIPLNVKKVRLPLHKKVNI